jgi:hypothetical protein
MIQRKQSIYLFLIALTSALLLIADPLIYEYVPAQPPAENASYKFEISYNKIDKIVPGEAAVSKPNSYMIYILSLLLVQSILSIFLFRNRKRQLMLCRLSYVLMFVLPLLVYLEINHIKTGVSGTEAGLLPGAFVPFLLPLFNLMAIRGIRADEELIRSMNRLR